MLDKMNRLISERIFDLTNQKNDLLDKYGSTPDSDFYTRARLKNKIDQVEDLLKINKEWFVYNQGYLQ